MLNVARNHRYDESPEIIVSIVTPVYNRKSLLPRTFASVQAQTVRCFEHIVVDDGSTDAPEEFVVAYLRQADYPITFIQKDNGGVHTARNAALDVAKGRYTVFLDSDDELLPEAIESMVSEWSSIPEKKRSEYREVCGLVRDENDHLIGSPFPDGINKLEWPDAWAACAHTGGEHFACMRTDILKGHRLPEPEGVKFVTEAILWDKLAKLGYKSWFFNVSLRVQHTEGDDHLSSVGTTKKSVQGCVDSLWNSTYLLNEWDLHRGFQFSYLKTLLTCGMMRWILRIKRVKTAPSSGLLQHKDRVAASVISPVALAAAIVYLKKRM
jgi:glycosyltransferase involved in cell wall biosynthesis